MAADALAVLLGGRAIGEVERLSAGGLRFRYDDRYRADAVATPLSVSMPLAADACGDMLITPWLWGLLPDNADVLARWGRNFSVSAASPFALLGTPIGCDCSGAVQFCSPAEVPRLLNRRADLVALSESDVAERLRLLRVDATRWLGRDFTGQFSLGGAQAKTALHLSADGWGESRGSLPTTHIVKPAAAGFKWLDLNEHICLTAASEAGLSAARSSICTFEDETAVVVERFDRARHGSVLKRIHSEDFCQALSLHPARKYQADGGPSPERIAEVLRGVVVGSTVNTDLWRFVDALAFNWLIAGTDGHAKNYSLLLASGRVRLAPLYDIASMLPYDSSNGFKLKLAMKIGDEYRLRRTDRWRAWERAADKIGLNQQQVLARVHDLAVRLPEAFQQAISSEHTRALDTDFPQRLAELATHRAEHCAAITA